MKQELWAQVGPAAVQLLKPKISSHITLSLILFLFIFFWFTVTLGKMDSFSFIHL